MEKIIKPIEINKSYFSEYGDLISTNDVNPMDINAGYAKRFDNLANLDTSKNNGKTIVSIFSGPTLQYNFEPEIENFASGMPQVSNSPEETNISLGSRMLLGLHHEAVVEIARTSLTGEEITQITYGSIIELDKVAGEPVELVIDGKSIARGEIVQINNDKLGIRILGIVQD